MLPLEVSVVLMRVLNTYCEYVRPQVSRGVSGSVCEGISMSASGESFSQQDLSWNDCHCSVHVDRVKTPMSLGDFAEARPCEPFRRKQCFRGFIVLLNASKDFFHARGTENPKRVVQ